MCQELTGHYTRSCVFSFRFDCPARYCSTKALFPSSIMRISVIWGSSQSDKARTCHSRASRFSRYVCTTAQRRYKLDQVLDLLTSFAILTSTSCVPGQSLSKCNMQHAYHSPRLSGGRTTRPGSGPRRRSNGVRPNIGWHSCKKFRLVMWRPGFVHKISNLLGRKKPIER